jgi:NAD(P)-dependent dehydrogenase (short-subunit alcohol dehydrogenase family)
MARQSRNPDRVALVTGASAGIGVAVAEEFAARGHAVGIVGRDAGRLDEVRRRLESAGGRVLALPGDLADLVFAESTVRRVAAEFGRLDVLVNNAAARELVTMREIEPEQWERTIRICLTAPAFLARWGRPEEVAKAVAWAASDDASYLTGTTLVLDGGWSRMHMPPHVTQAVVGGPRRA